MRAARPLALIVSLVLTATSAPAETLVGDSVAVKSDTTFSFDPTTTTVIVGPGQELTAFATLWNIDIGPNSIDIRPSQWFGLNSPDRVQGLLFSDLDWSPIPQRITGFSVDTSKGAYDPSRITFGDDFVFVDFAGSRGYNDGDYGDWYTSDYVTINLQTVPEPSSFIGLVSLSILGLVLAGRRLRRPA